MPRNAKLTTATRAAAQQLVSVRASGSFPRPAAPLRSHVNATSDDEFVVAAYLVEAAEDRVVTASAMSARRLYHVVLNCFLVELVGLLAASEQQIVTMVSLVRDALGGADGSDDAVEDLTRALTEPQASSAVYRAQVAELVAPTLRAILDVLAGTEQAIAWNSSDDLTQAVLGNLDVEGFIRVSGLGSVVDAEIVINACIGALWDVWSKGEADITYHCDRFFQIGPSGIGLRVEPRFPAVVGQFVERDGHETVASAVRSAEIRLLPVRPVEFLLTSQPNPAVCAVDLTTGREVLRLAVSDEHVLRVSQGGIAVAQRTGRSLTTSIAGPQVVDLGSTVLFETDAMEDGALGSGLSRDRHPHVVSDSSDLKSLGLFDVVNAIHRD